MGQHMLAPIELGFIDKDKNARGDGKNHRPGGSYQGANAAPFLCTGPGTTTTLVGAAANLTTSLNCLRLGERFVLTNAAGVPKENTVFTVTAHNGTTTVTFTPAAAVATANGDQARLVSSDAFSDMDALDAALIATGVYTQAKCDQMNLNDKIYAYRTIMDPKAWST